MTNRNAGRLHGVTFAQLCVIAKTILEADPTIDNFEWCECIKDKLIRARLGYPEKPEAIHDAMRAVESRVPRPPPQLRPPRPPAPPSEPKAPPTPEGLALRDAIQAKLDAIVRGKAIPSLTGPTKTEEQINAWRSSLPRPVHKRNAKGWIRVADHEPPDRDV